MEDGGWPIYNELSLKRSCADFDRLQRHGADHPEDVIVSRIPEIEQHIIQRAVELDLFNELPFALRQQATGRVLDVLMGDIALLAEEMVQLARETGSSSDGGAR